MSSTPSTNEACDGTEIANDLSIRGKEDGHTAVHRRSFLSEAHPMLENLPSELRSEILSNVGDLRTLRSLVRASPTYHEQYRLDRDRFLQRCLMSELDGFFVDAFATLRSRVRQLGRARTDEAITAFLDSYRDWSSGPDSAASEMSIRPSDIHWLCGFHLSVALPLAESFCHWAITNLTRAAVSSTQQTIQEELQVATDKMDLSLISQSERIRVLRALYRCETYHHLFGRNKGTRIGAFRRSEIAEIFFNIFQPWEAEEIGCIDLFTQQKYTEVFNEVKADLHPDSPRFDDDRGHGDPDGSYELDKFWDDYMTGTISRGLTMTARVISIMKNYDQLVDRMARFLTPDHNLDAPMSDSLGTIAQCDRRENLNYTPNAKDEAEGVELLPFRGDEVPPSGPPLAWVILWGGKYVNIYGGYVPESLKSYGWVIWDKSRLNSMGVRKLIADQWNTAPKLIEEIQNDYPWLNGVGKSPDAQP